MEMENLGAVFMPHGYCFLWVRELLLLHVGADALIALAYFSIPATLFLIARKRPDLEFTRIFLLFAVFITACGITHVLNVWNIWHADYWLSGWAKFVTAFVSVATAIALWQAVPQAISWPSPAQLKLTNDQLKKEIEKRRISEQQLNQAFDKAPIGKALVSLDGDFIKVNQALCSIVGYSREELLQLDFQSITYRSDLEVDLSLVRELTEGKRNTYDIEKRYVNKAGHLVWVLLSASVVRSEQGEPLFFIAQIIDITYRKLVEEESLRSKIELEKKVFERTAELEMLNKRLHETNAKLSELSYIDDLTGLYNRRYLNHKIDELVSESARYDTTFSMSLIDIDHFKEINDHHGHPIGDVILARFSQLLRDNLRVTDIAARVGGDEFCIVMPHTALEQAHETLDKVRTLLEAERFTGNNDQQIGITCSIGMTSHSGGEIDHKTLYKRADDALYAAKKRGRNVVELF